MYVCLDFYHFEDVDLLKRVIREIGLGLLTDQEDALALAMMVRSLCSLYTYVITNYFN